MHIEAAQERRMVLGTPAYAPVRIETSAEGAGEARTHAPVRIEASAEGAGEARAYAPGRTKAELTGAGDAKAYAPVRIEARATGGPGAGDAKAYAPVRIEASASGGPGAGDARAYAPVRIEASAAGAGEARAYAPGRTKRCEDEERALGALSDAELLDSTLVVAARANRAVVTLLAHLAEVEARGVHRLCACSSLYTYCRYELGMPEDTAQRRALAARLVRRFPLLLDKLASGELHLSGLLLLGPHLKEENLEQMLAAARHRTKREILALVRRLDPRPDVPARIEPLGPAPRARGMAANAVGAGAADAEAGAGAEDWPSGSGAESGAETGAGSGADTNTDADTGAGAGSRCLDVGEASVGQRFKVQFTAREEYVRLLQEAQELLGPGENGHVVAEVHLRAMRLLVRELKKRKCALVDEPRRTRASASTRRCGSDDGDRSDPRLSVRGDARAGGRVLEESRRLPAEVRRGVWQRDGGRCAFIDARGRRCRERSGLEFHHEIAFAKGGRHQTELVSLRCRAHNALAAEADFGEAHMARCARRGASGTAHMARAKRCDHRGTNYCVSFHKLASR
ncbi:MAG: hypothetical protein R3B13_36835 [Polyangiaceae bacterium]